jgi:hypothetical protein
MNRTPLVRRRVAASVACATAVAVGATLLAYPDAATAQSGGVDCAALGENPRAAGLEQALEAAIGCGVEVRIDARATPYATVYATPEGQLHYVGTAAPVQDNLGQGGADATLSEAGGVLVQTNTSSPIALSHSDIEAPLLATGQAELDWAGVQPEPTYSGTVASYGEIAPGLGLSIEAGVSSADLTFTVADAAAWDEFDTGLKLAGGATARIVEDAIYIPAANGAEFDFSTPFTVRDAAGTSYRAGLALAADGTLTASVPEAALTASAFPLTVTATWADYSPGATIWGAVTAANPDLSLYRGEAGLAEPYFEAAGANATAVVGGYCDQLVDPDCASVAQASSYWGFHSPRLSGILPGDAPWLSLTAVSGSFRVDAAEGSACVAPELARAALYFPARSWNFQPIVSTASVDGACQDGSAVYDVTPLFFGTWTSTLGMAASADTARFDGDSARLDVLLDIQNYRAPTLSCSTHAPDAKILGKNELTYGGFTAGVWRPDLLDASVSWTATVKNYGTGELLAATEPVAIVNGTNSSATLTGLADGVYEVRYEFVAGDPRLSSTKTCYFSVDTSQPDFVSMEPNPGPYYIGDTVSVDVTVADAGFPNGATALNVGCRGGDMCGDVDDVILDGDTTATFEFELQEAFNYAIFDVDDPSGKYDISSSVYFPATPNTYDYNGDRYQDMYLVRRSDGQLLYYPGKGDGKLGTPIAQGAGWGRMDIVMAGDLTEDGVPDLLARDARTGTLYTYPGNGNGGFASRRTVGAGWNAMSSFTAAGDFDNSGTVDMYSLRQSDGSLYFYPGRGDGTFGGRVKVETPTGGNGWGRFDSVITIAPLGNDAQPDLFFHNSVNGRNQYVETESDGSVEDSTSHLGISTIQPDGHDMEFTQLAAVGDQDADGSEEFLGVDSRTGELVLINGIGFQPTATVLSKSGGGFKLPAIDFEHPYDYDSDLDADLFGVRSGSADLRFYPGTGAGLYGPSRALGHSLDMNLVETAGDINGDGYADLLIRDSRGLLEVYPGDGEGRISSTPVIAVGTGWNVMSAILSGHDYNEDGTIDVLAREHSTGILWLYPGRGTGKLGTRVKIGTGWNAMRDLASVGDFDHDGHADMLAIRNSDGCLYFYGGRGDGTFKPLVQIGCGWGGYDAVTAAGDLNADGHADFLARRKSDGVLFLYPGNGTGGHGTRTQVGTGWNAMKFIA